MPQDEERASSSTVIEDDEAELEQMDEHSSLRHGAQGDDHSPPANVQSKKPKNAKQQEKKLPADDVRPAANGALRQGEAPRLWSVESVGLISHGFGWVCR
ncbi:hypothetical protein PRIC2_006360 [Phytophthora ramorum]